MHQITEAKSAGYDEYDIVNGVIRVMTPSLTLRNVLEIAHKLRLKKLMQFTEVHYNERNATDLCSKLTRLTQLSEETAYYFVMRCIELSWVLLPSLKSDVDYDKALVLKLFFKILEKGIASTYILSEIKDLLRKGAPNEDFIEVVTRAFASEKERIAIQSKSKE